MYCLMNIKEIVIRLTICGGNARKGRSACGHGLKGAVQVAAAIGEAAAAAAAVESSAVVVPPVGASSILASAGKRP